MTDESIYGDCKVKDGVPYQEVIYRGHYLFKVACPVSLCDTWVLESYRDECGVNYWIVTSGWQGITLNLGTGKRAEADARAILALLSQTPE